MLKTLRNLPSTPLVPLISSLLIKPKKLKMPVEYLDEKEVEKCLNWETLIPKMESALSQISENSIIQPERIMMHLPDKNGVFLAMPGYSSRDSGLGCKLVTSFPNNSKINLPSVMATILLFDVDTGKPEMILESTSITGWRTAATSAAATIHLHRNKKEILSIFGTGVQAKSHALAFQNRFSFKEVRIWGRNFESARRLCREMGPEFKACESGEECARDADVIVTATYADKPIVQYSWLKPGVLINAVGAGAVHHSELSMEIYKNATVVVDQLAASEKELKGLIDSGIPIWGEVGQIINKKPFKESSLTIFHSLGMAIEDVLTAKLVCETYRKSKLNK